MSDLDRRDVDAHLAAALHHLEATESVVVDLDGSVALTPAERSELSAMAFSICRVAQELAEALEGPDIVYDLTTDLEPDNEREVPAEA